MGVVSLGTSAETVLKQAPWPQGTGKTYNTAFNITGGKFCNIAPGLDSSATFTQYFMVGVDSYNAGASILMTGYDGTATYTDSILIDGVNFEMQSSTHGAGFIMGVAEATKDIYFGGNSPTVAQVYNKLVDNYGEYDAFAFPTFYGGAYLGLINPNDNLGTIEDIVGSGSNTTVQTSAMLPYSYPITLGSTITTPASVTTEQLLCAYILFGTPQPENRLRFDVYLQGSSEPVIDVKWSVVSSDPTFTTQLVSSVVGRYPYSYIEIQDVPLFQWPVAQGVNIWELNSLTGRQEVDKYTWANSFHSQYITECQNVLGQYTSFENVLYYHDAEIADKLVLYLRFQYQVNAENTGKMTYGQMFSVEIPRTGITTTADIVVTEIADSAFENDFETEVVVHLGAPPETPGDEGGGPPPPDPDPTPYPGGGTLPPGVVPDPFTTPTGFPGNAILTKTYAMTGAVLQNVGTKLWTQSYYDVLKVQNNPIENIVSCKWFPFSLTGTQGDIKIGDISFGINADRITSLYKMHIGEATFNSPYNTDHFLAYSPFCQVKLHLPYIGIVELDATQIMGRTLSIDYAIDLITGDCIAIIRAKFNSVYMPILNVGGHMGVDIPLTGSNRVQQEIKAAGTTISASLGAAAHLMGGDALGAAQNAAGGFVNIAGMDYATQRTSSHSPACASMEEIDVWAEVWYIPYEVSDGFKYLHGYPCHKYLKLSQVSGFTKVDTRTKIDIAMTEEENRMLEELLTTGIYV